MTEQNNLNSMIKTMNKTSIVNKDILQAAISQKQYDEKVLKFDLNEISLNLSKVFGFESNKSKFKDDDYAIMFGKTYCNLIELINLENYRKTVMSLSVNDLAHYCGCCKIAENKYFVYGGHASSYSSSAKIIDIKAKFVETLASDSPIGYNGICLFNDEVYCFGGHNGSYYLNISKKFDLKTKVWINIQPLPKDNGYTSASAFSNKILVCGYSCQQLYDYNPYQNLFTISKYILTANEYKYIFENWIVEFGKGLYEIEENSNLTKRQEFKDSGNGLNSSATFRRGNYIYFITYGPKLYRIKTETKTIESINFI